MSRDVAHRRQRIILCLSIGLLGVIASTIPAMLRLEEVAGLDWLFRVRGPVEAPAEVVVISIDAESADVLGVPRNPLLWPRSLHAELVRRLSAADVGVIAFDIIFDSPREEAHDLDFSEAVRSAGNVVLLERLRIDAIDAQTSDRTRPRLERRIPPIALLSGAALATAPFPLPRDPEKVSQFWLFGPSDPDVPTLPGMVLHAYARDTQPALTSLIENIRPGTLEPPGDQPGEATASLSEMGSSIRQVLRNDPQLGEQLLSRLLTPAVESERDGRSETEQSKLVALARMYAGNDSRYLNFYGPMRALRTIPYHRIIAEEWDPSDWNLAGKAVFVGFSDELPIDQQDTFFTAFSQRGESLSGVEIGATAFANMLHDTEIHPLPLPWHYLLVLVLGVSITAGLTAMSTRRALVTALVAGLAYFLVAATVFRSGVWLPILIPVLLQLPVALLAVFAWNYHHAKAQTERARQTLGYYLPAQVVERLSRSSAAGRLCSELLHGTCLVTDAAQYTSLSERLRPQELHNLLNEYYGVLFAEIDRYGGFVSDVVGDSMVAMWAGAKPDPIARTSACRAAQAILLAVERFNAEHEGNHLPTRVGIHSGQVLLGDIGAESHFEYRAVGDIVNTATRIQELNKRLDTNLLLSAEVVAGDSHATTRCIGRFVLAGKSIPLELHDLMGLGGEVPSDRHELIARFGVALSRFQGRRWKDAAESFENLLGEFPGDGPSRFYLSLCRQYLLADPGPSWPGHVVVAANT